MMIENPRKPILGLLIEGDIGYYYRRNDSIPYIMDRRFVVDSDKVILVRSRIIKNKHGLKSNQEFTQTWEAMPFIYNDNNSMTLKHMIMAEKGFPDFLVRRVVTKYIDGSKRNLRSSNLVMAEVLTFSTIYSSDRKYEYYQFNSRLEDRKIVIKQEDLMKTFKEYCNQVPHPVVLSLDGILIAKRGC